MNQPSESNISLGDITERADKLETAPVEKPADGTTPEEKPEDKKETPAPKPEEKKAPNDPDELRKWNTKVSMELSEVKKQNTEMANQLKSLAETLSKTTRAKVDWKELAKDPVKLQAAIDAQQKEISDEWQTKYSTSKSEATAKITQKENARRFHDPAYPRWAELNQKVIDLAVKGDRRIDFEQDPDAVLDTLYKVAQDDAAADPNYKAPAPAPVANKDAKYTDADLQAKIAEAVKKAVADAQKGLAAEANGAGVGGMGQGAAKGKQGVDKQALHDMPLGDLKAALIRASEK